MPGFIIIIVVVAFVVFCAIAAPNCCAATIATTARCGYPLLFALIKHCLKAGKVFLVR
jgi:hypothetical protein